ncbi:MAG: hypothetical protein MJ241_00560 [Bacilli bacterium]|nr:hypothetical protein [Bacilli bacterium]
MNTDDIIRKFCDSIILDDRKDRMYYELTSRKQKGVDRFDHNAGCLIKKEKIILHGSLDEIVKYLNVNVKQDSVVFIVDHFNKTGECLTKEEFIKRLNSEYLALIGIIYPHLAIIKEENHSGKYIYLLKV